MTNDAISDALAAWTRDCDACQARIAIFERVRDLPYRYPSSRDPTAVLEQSAGSCSGKHYLLGELFRRHGLPVRHAICTHFFNDSQLPFPEEMIELLQKNEIVDFHDYLQIQVNGAWIDIDATWERALRDYGFPVTEDWDGKSTMILTVSQDDVELIEGDPEKAKEGLLSRLTPRQRKLREEFLVALDAWLTEIVGTEGD